MLELSMKCWNSAFNARDLRLTKVVVQLGAVKTYVATVEALREKERQDETQFTTKIDGFLSFIPRWMLMYFFVVFLNLILCMTKLRILVLCFSYFTDNSIIVVTKMCNLFTLSCSKRGRAPYSPPPSPCSKQQLLHQSDWTCTIHTTCLTYLPSHQKMGMQHACTKLCFTRMQTNTPLSSSSSSVQRTNKPLTCTRIRSQDTQGRKWGSKK
jgi:hypothetical protein